MCFLRSLMGRADRFAAQSTWKDFALVKFCLMSLGVLVGLSVPAKKRKGAGILAALVFLPTYILLLGRFLPFLNQGEDQGE